MSAKLQTLCDKGNSTHQSSLNKNSLPYLDTLAQVGTNERNEVCRRSACNKQGQAESEDFDLSLVAVTGLDDKSTLLKRARAKYLTDYLVKGLSDSARNNPKSLLRQSYWNSYHCAKTLTVSSDGKIKGSYCKNRWCMVCNRIRTAQLMNEYLPIMANWRDKHMVTLTVENCSGTSLFEVLRTMTRDFQSVQARIKKQFQRGQAERLKGLRKLECTYNAERNDFHPHFHIIVEGKENAEKLRQYWLDATFLTTAAAQDVRPADDKAAKELFKYFTKVISGKNKETRMVYADALDIVFNAVRGVRTFQTFGFDKLDKAALALARCEAVTDTDVETLTVDEMEWVVNDWYSIHTGEALTNYEPTEAMQQLAQEGIVIRRGHNWQPHSKQSELVTPAKLCAEITKPPKFIRIEGDAAKRGRRRGSGNELLNREILLIPFNNK